MKHVFTPLMALALIATGHTLDGAGWFSHTPTPSAEVRHVSSDPFTSEAAFRHRTAQPNHWRAMIMRK